MDYLVVMDINPANGTDWPESPHRPWYRYNVWVSGALCTVYGLVFCAGLFLMTRQLPILFCFVIREYSCGRGRFAWKSNDAQMRH